MGHATLTFDETYSDNDSDADTFPLTASTVEEILGGSAGTSGLRERRKPAGLDDTHKAEPDDGDQEAVSWMERVPGLARVRDWWTLTASKYVSIDFYIKRLHDWIEKRDRDRGVDSDNAKRFAEYAAVVKKNLKYIVACFVALLVLYAFLNYYMYADSKFVAHAKPWHAEYETLHSFSAIADAFDNGRVLVVYETDVGRVTGTYPTVAAPVFEHVQSQREHIDALKDRLEKHAQDFCDSKWKPTVVCPQLSGLAAAMITVCRGASSTHMYNPVMIEGSKAMNVPQQLEMFLSHAHDTVKVRGTMFGVSTKPRYSFIKVSHNGWDGEMTSVLKDDEAVSAQTCLDLIRGDVGTLLEPIAVAEFLA